ncbi:MAG: MOSC N-terminal beta barrel domain-containing protein, partial [Gammaproteobacteria bacterium]
MWIQELWRYPVKSMAGERLESAEITRTGIVGDRRVLVVG